MSEKVTSQTTLAEIKAEVFLKKYENKIISLLPRHISLDRIIRIASAEIQKNPELEKCTAFSFFGSIIESLQLGLEPSSIQGYSYLVPYGKNIGTRENPKWAKICQFQVGYQGLIALHWRNGVNVIAHSVFEKDEFQYQYGTNPFLVHVPFLETKESRGNYKCSYAIATFKDGRKEFLILPKKEVDEAMRASKSTKTGTNGTKSNPVWDNHYSEMANKTAVRRLSKYLPKDDILGQAIYKDEEAERFEQNNGIIFENEPSLESNKKSVLIGQKLEERHKDLNLDVSLISKEIDENTLDEIEKSLYKEGLC